MSRDPAASGTPFELFYHGTFEPLLEKLDNYESGPVFSGGHDIKGASWDRKAAWLLWMFINGMEAP